MQRQRVNQTPRRLIAPSQLTKPLQPAKLRAINRLMLAKRRMALKQVRLLNQKPPLKLPPTLRLAALQLPQQQRRRWHQPTKRRRFRRGISVCILLSCQAIILARLAPGSGAAGFKRRLTTGQPELCASRKTRRRLMATTWMCR